MKVVVLTCDKYEWLLPIFFHFYNKYWPGNPYQTDVITETNAAAVHNGNFTDPKPRVFCTGGTAWTTGILDYIKQAGDDKFLLTPEDYVLKSPVNTDLVREAEKLCSGHVGCVRLNAPDKYFRSTKDIKGVDDFKDYPLDRPYSMSMQAAIWQKDYLLDVLRDKEDAWQAEIEGSKRLANMIHKWRVYWTKKAIWDYQAGGFMLRGRARLEVVKWTIADLLKEIGE